MPFQKTEIQVVSEPLQNGQLHLYVRDGQQALPLLPLVRMIAIPETEQNACYFYNRMERNEIRFVSYHFGRESDVTRSFEDTAEALRMFQPSIE